MEKAVATQPVQLKVIDMAEQVRAKLSHGEFSQQLLEAITARLAKKEQVIVFKNRRGYAPFLRCPNCGHVPHCQNCDISLTFHKQANLLRCHYCGFLDERTHKCGVCGHVGLEERGLGTERLEEQLQERFPGATVARMDQDTTRGKSGYSRLIERLEQGEIDILVGTQMVTKGLDFERVTLVAVVDADRLLNWPDFRAHENAFQLLKQFEGRAGRKHRPGTFLVQSYQPEHPVLKLLQATYTDFYEAERLTREGPLYPPATRLIRIELRNRDRTFLEEQASAYVELLRQHIGVMVLGPEYPAVQRIRNLYRQQVLLKIRPNQSPKRVKEWILELTDRYYRNAPKKTLQVVFDVDPR